MSEYEPVETFALGATPSQAQGIIRAIYCIVNRATGNRYVGSSEHLYRRLRAHINQLRRDVHHSLRLRWAWKTHGIDGFSVEVLEIVSDGGDIIEIENSWLRRLMPQYNYAECADNPMRGKRHTAASIQKMRENRRGKGCGKRPATEAFRAARKTCSRKERPECRGKKRTQEARSRMSAAAKRKFERGFANGRTRKVEVGGVMYSSGKDAAHALSISHPALIKRIKQGRGRYLE